MTYCINLTYLVTLSSFLIHQRAKCSYIIYNYYMSYLGRFYIIYGNTNVFFGNEPFAGLKLSCNGAQAKSDYLETKRHTYKDRFTMQITTTTCQGNFNQPRISASERDRHGMLLHFTVFWGNYLSDLLL